MVSMETAELHWGEGLVVGMAPVGQQGGPLLSAHDLPGMSACTPWSATQVQVEKEWAQRTVLGRK